MHACMRAHVYGRGITFAPSGHGIKKALCACSGQQVPCNKWSPSPAHCIAVAFQQRSGSSTSSARIDLTSRVSQPTASIRAQARHGCAAMRVHTTSGTVSAQQKSADAGGRWEERERNGRREREARELECQHHLGVCHVSLREGLPAHSSIRVGKRHASRLCPVNRSEICYVLFFFFFFLRGVAVLP